MTSSPATKTSSRTIPDLQARLAEGLQALGIEASETQRQQLLDFLALLTKWNAVYNLTSVREPSDMLAVHVLDSLSILPLIDPVHGRCVLDVGSGAGLPAIPLAIIGPGLTLHSIDAVAKKIGFQLQVKTSLRLANLYPRHARIESATLDAVPHTIVSRAFADIASMLQAVEHLADERTLVIAMKGRKPIGEIASLPPRWAVDFIRNIDVPFLGAERCAVGLRRAPAAADGR